MFKLTPKKARRGALGVAGTLALVFFNRPSRIEIIWLSIPVAILIAYGLSGWVTKHGLSAAERIGRSVVLVVGCFGGVFLYARHFWPLPPTALSAQAPAPIQSHALRHDVLPSLEISAHLQADRAPYSDGTIVAGIRWNKLYEDVRINLSSGANELVDVDGIIGLDTQIGAMGQLSNFPGSCTSTPLYPGDEPPEFWLGGKDKHGKSTSLPVIPNPGATQTSPEYRFHCDRILARSTLQFVVASIKINEVINRMCPSLMALRTPPKLIRIVGQYKVRDSDKSFPISFETSL